MVRWMQRFFQYLDRFYVEMYNITNLTDQGMKQFKTTILERQLVQLGKAIEQQIYKERMGQVTDIDSIMLSKVVEAFIVLSREQICTEGVNPLTDLE